MFWRKKRVVPEVVYFCSQLFQWLSCKKIVENTQARKIKQ